MNAARALIRAGLDTDEVRLTLHPVRPESVNLYPASPAMKRLWGEGVNAITLGRWVFVDPEILSGDAEGLGRLALHELLHLRQIDELGLVRFLWRYLADYAMGRARRLGHREAYREIGLERDARRITDVLSEVRPPI